jgi:hypothetical protein
MQAKNPEVSQDPGTTHRDRLGMPVITATQTAEAVGCVGFRALLGFEVRIS